MARAPQSMKDALTASLKDEKDAVEERLAKADAYFSTKEPPAAQGREEAKKETPPKERVIRDGFTMPAGDYKLIAEIQSLCLQAGISATKSEVLRAGLHLLRAMDPGELKEHLTKLEKIKPGRRAGN